MPTKVTSAQESARDWASRAGSASGKYSLRAQAAANDWETNAKAAGPNYKAAISAGDIDKRFTGGISKAGSGKYSSKIKDLGESRYSTGVQKAEGDYSSGVAPYLNAIASVTPPARRPRGDPANLARISPYTTALAALRLRTKAAGG